MKHPPLHAPVQLRDDGSQISLVEAFDLGKKKNLFLKIGSKLQQLCDLRHARAGHASQLGELCIIPDRFLANQRFKPNGQPFFRGWAEIVFSRRFIY